MEAAVRPITVLGAGVTAFPTCSPQVAVPTKAGIQGAPSEWTAMVRLSPPTPVRSASCEGAEERRASGAIVLPTSA